MTIMTFKEVRRALEHDDVDRIREAMEDGLEPTMWLDADSGDALLAVAVEADSLKCAELLLANGGDWSLSAEFDEDLISPFALAVRKGSSDMVRTFLRFGSVESYAPEWLEAAMAELILRPCGDRAVAEAFEALIARPGGVSQPFADGSLRPSFETKAESCSKKCADPALAERWAAIAQSFRGVGLQLVELFDQIELLAANGHSTRVKRLLESLPRGAHAEGAGRALVYAASRDKPRFAEELIERGADCSLQLFDGSTALMKAARKGNLSLVRRLLAAGADITARQHGPRGKTAQEMAGTRLVAAYLKKQLEKRESRP